MLNERPERRVVEIVDVTVCLSPAQIVPQVAVRRVEDAAGVEGGRGQELLVGEKLRPLEHVVGGEETHDVAHELCERSGI